MTISNPDKDWLRKAIELLRDVHYDAPELFSESDEEVLWIALEIKDRLEIK